MFKPTDFPVVGAVPAEFAGPKLGDVPPRPERGAVERARRYLAAIPPAVAGQHGDADTFRVCCRLIRGFALDEDDALAVLSEWNRQCQPPWTEPEMRAKLRSARRNGREPVGGLLKT